MNQPRLGGAIPAWEVTDRLAKARTFARMNQFQLAQALGISERTVKRYEAGAPLKRAILLGWAMACGVNPVWLETGELPDDDGDGGTLVTGRGTARYPHSNQGFVALDLVAA